MAAIDTLTSAGASSLKQFDAWALNPNVDVFYKALILVFALIVLGVIPATRTFAGYAAWSILLILLVQPSS